MEALGCLAGYVQSDEEHFCEAETAAENLQTPSFAICLWSGIGNYNDWSRTVWIALNRLPITVLVSCQLETMRTRNEPFY